MIIKHLGRNNWPPVDRLKTYNICRLGRRRLKLTLLSQLVCPSTAGKTTLACSQQ